MRRIIERALVVGAMTLCASWAGAQETAPFPDRAIKLVVSSPPGSTPDVGARVVAKYMSIELKQPVVVENKPGANGLIAARKVFTSPPDGYTFLVAPSGTMSITPHVYKKRAADLLTRLSAVGQIFSADFSLVANADGGLKSVGDIIKAAQDSPGKLVAAVSGLGSVSHAAIELFKKSAGVDIYAVSFNTSPAAAIAVASGEADVLFETITSTDPVVKSGKANRIAMTGAERFVLTPDIPTVSESGLKDFVITIWAGLFAPQGVPEDRVNTISSALAVALKEPELIKLFHGAGLLPGKYSTPQAFDVFWRNQSDMWQSVVEATPVLNLEK